MTIGVAIDGPAGAGKSTISKKVAKMLELEYIDTGAMYRAITYKIIRDNVNIDDERALQALLDSTQIDFENNHIVLDGNNVDNLIRDQKINENVSNVASVKAIRLWLVEKQRAIAENKNVIMDGRDIGTYVLPKASVKIFLTASAAERGRRRYEELIIKGEKVTLKEIIESIEKRDYIDSHREFAPLKQADDAIILDSTELGIDDVVEEIIQIVKKVI